MFLNTLQCNCFKSVFYPKVLLQLKLDLETEVYCHREEKTELNENKELISRLLSSKLDFYKIII